MCHIGQYSVFCGQWASHHKSTPRPLSVDTLQIQPASKWSITKILTKITIAAISAPPCHVRYIFIIHIIFSHSQISNPGVLCYSLMSMSNNNISDEVSNNAMNLCAGAGHFQKFVTVMFCFVTHRHCHECHVTSSSLSQQETQTMPIERKQITRKSTAHKNCIVANIFIVTKCKLTNLFPWCVINSF